MWEENEKKEVDLHIDDKSNQNNPIEKKRKKTITIKWNKNS